jgi:hypothetical protein
MQLTGFILLHILSHQGQCLQGSRLLDLHRESNKNNVTQGSRIYCEETHLELVDVRFNSFQLQMQSCILCGTIYTKLLSRTATKVDKINSFYRYIAWNKSCINQSWLSGESPKSISQMKLYEVHSFFGRSTWDENYLGNESYGLICDTDMLRNECRMGSVQMEDIVPRTALIGRKYWGGQ